MQQDLAHVPTLSVLDNMALGSGFPTSWGTIRENAGYKQAKEDLAKLSLDIDPKAMVSTLAASERTGVAIAGALREDPDYPQCVLVLVVPTAPRPFTIAEMEADPIRLNNQLGHYSYFANLLDLCAVAVPNGALPCGVPMGVTLLAPAWADERLAGIARQFEAGSVEQRPLAAASA